MGAGGEKAKRHFWISPSEWFCDSLCFLDSSTWSSSKGRGAKMPRRPHLESPGFAFPFLHLPQANWLSAAVPVFSIHTPQATLSCYDGTGGLLRHRQEDFQLPQLWLYHQDPEFLQTLCKSLCQETQVFCFLHSGLSHSQSRSFPE